MMTNDEDDDDDDDDDDNDITIIAIIRTLSIVFTARSFHVSALYIGWTKLVHCNILPYYTMYEYNSQNFNFDQQRRSQYRPT